MLRLKLILRRNRFHQSHRNDVDPIYSYVMTMVYPFAFLLPHLVFKCVCTVMYYLGVFTYSYFLINHTRPVSGPERELVANYLSIFGVHNTSGLKKWTVFFFCSDLFRTDVLRSQLL